MAKYYTIVCNNFKAKKVTKFTGKCYTIVCNNSKAKKVTKFTAKYYTIIVCNNCKVFLKSPNLWQM